MFESQYCPYCHGSGYIQIDCPECWGSGKKQPYVCPECRGKGCDDDGNRCYSCSGDGTIYEYCDRCGGDGKIDKVCSYCR